MSHAILRRSSTWVALGVALAVVGVVAAAELKVGDKAPPFTMKGSDGKTYTLDEFKGKQAVVLAWYPKAFTGGCTKECTSFRTKSKEMKELKVAYFTASVDTVDENTKFANSLNADYPILSDPDKTVARAYGVLNDRGMASRYTYYIDKNGVIKEIDKKVNAANAADDVIAKVKSLGLVGE
jgi:peroxiredoxin Q/BCP